MMGRVFRNLEDAVVWLMKNNWRRNDHGEWLKGEKRADIHPSPFGDGGVCLVFSKSS